MPIKSRNEIEAIKAPISPNKLCNNLYILIQKPLVFILLDRLLGASLYNDDFIAIRLKTEKDKIINFCISSNAETNIKMY